MSAKLYPCIVYHRIRAAAPEASDNALRAAECAIRALEVREQYWFCDAIGDTEYAPAFSGGYEIRPGFERARKRAKRLASKHGSCTILVSDASPIEDGDPFLPAIGPIDENAPVHVRLANFHLRPHASSTSLRAAWRLFDAYKAAEKVRAASSSFERAAPDYLSLMVDRDAARRLANLYLTNPMPHPLDVTWRQFTRTLAHSSARIEHTEWKSMTLPARGSVYVETVLQGELPWVRLVRVKQQLAGCRTVGSAQISPSDLLRDEIPLVWESYGT